MELLDRKIDVLVIGCGVSGLTSGIRLIENNFSVTILARDLPPDTTSDVPAAIWYPYLPDTEESNRLPVRQRIKKWARVTYEEGRKLAKVPEESGVTMVKFAQLFQESEYEQPWWIDCEFEKISKFEKLAKENLPPYYQDKDGSGYTLEVPLFETPKYMPYLVTRFKQSGGRIIKTAISKISDLYDDNRLIVNCTGLGAREVVGDKSVFPKRGQIIRVKASGINHGMVDETPPSPNSFIFGYIVPRPLSKDCILGGTAEKYDANLEPVSETAKEIKRLCQQLAPNLEILEVLEHKVGLRPERPEVRLEKIEPVFEYKKLAIIHNYGHSGSGFTLAWGCADEVIDLAREFRNSA